MIRSISAAATRDITTSGNEYALLDVREEGAFSKERLMLASCLPLSRLELRCGGLVPRKSTPVIVMDGGGDRLAEIAAARLETCGYTDIRLLAGGIEAWRAAGYPLYSGVNVMTKAFGEIVHSQCRTPDVSAEELKNWIDSGRDLAILDARPYAEYHEHTIPSAISVPGAELVLRAADVVPGPDTTIVVNCAGRTRSIIGCQSLINAGIPNRVYCLRNGTMGWKLAGFDVEYGATRTTGTCPNGDQAKARARALALELGVETVTPERLNAMKEDGARTVYLFDVRTPDAFARRHLPGARNAPGGQLVQAMDDYVAVRNSVVVLTDPLLLRAVMTASWLGQIAQCEALVLDPAPTSSEVGVPHPSLHELRDLPVISVAGLAERLAAPDPPLVLDLSTSVEHRAGHIPGAYWTVRGRDDAVKDALPTGGTIVLTGPNTALLRLAAPEIAAATGTELFMLDGGFAAWRSAGGKLETGLPRPIGPVDDVWYKPYELDDPAQERSAALAYLDWEVELTAKVAADTVKFHPMRLVGREGG